MQHEINPSTGKSGNPIVRAAPTLAQEAFDFVRYKIQASAISDPNGFARYMSWLDTIIKKGKG